MWVLNVPPSHLSRRGPQWCSATRRCVPACPPPRGSPPRRCAAQGGALPLGLEQVNGEMSHRVPIVHQLARSPSARGVLFVCSSPKYSPGSHQIKSQLTSLWQEAGCGMRSLAGSWEGDAGRVRRGPVPDTPHPDQSITGALAGSHHQSRTSATPLCTQNP